MTRGYPVDTETNARGSLDQTVELLGGSGTLKRRIRSQLEAHDLLVHGIPAKAFDHFISKTHVFRIDKTMEKTFGMSVRTYQRNKKTPNKALSPEQSGKTWKVAELMARVIAIFGSEKEAETWFESPAMALEQRRPLDMLSTPKGIELVEDHLTRLEYGVYT
jgi:putative toxin-antitoxin system antitoxin component (TIGR02293 family)